MDEALEVVDVAADLGLEGAVMWLLRVVGLLLILGGIGVVVLLPEVTLLVPVAMIVAGLVLLVAPNVLLFLAEFA